MASLWKRAKVAEQGAGEGGGAGGWKGVEQVWSKVEKASGNSGKGYREREVGGHYKMIFLYIIEQWRVYQA